MSGGRADRPSVRLSKHWANLSKHWANLSKRWVILSKRWVKAPGESR
jgi:hypothetical protein